MPQEIICSGCGYVLYEGEILRTPQDIIRKYEGKCPNCGKELDSEVMKIDITSSEEVKETRRGGKNSTPF